MTARSLVSALAVAALASMPLMSAPAQAADPVDNPGVAVDVAKAYAATAKYAVESLALKDGFVRTDDCASDPELGGMGYHYVKPANVGSTDPRRPAALLYEDAPRGQRKLVAVEYVVNDADQDLSTDGDRPTMFGKPFQGPMPGHVPGQPIHYDLHAWLYKDNPSGRFAEWNPRVRCPKA